MYEINLTNLSLGDVNIYVFLERARKDDIEREERLKKKLEFDQPPWVCVTYDTGLCYECFALSLVLQISKIGTCRLGGRGVIL